MKPFRAWFLFIVILGSVRAQAGQRYVCPDVERGTDRPNRFILDLDENTAIVTVGKSYYIGHRDPASLLEKLTGYARFIGFDDWGDGRPLLLLVENKLFRGVPTGKIRVKTRAENENDSVTIPCYFSLSR